MVFDDVVVVVVAEVDADVHRKEGLVIEGKQTFAIGVFVGGGI